MPHSAQVVGGTGQRDTNGLVEAWELLLAAAEAEPGEPNGSDLVVWTSSVTESCVVGVGDPALVTQRTFGNDLAQVAAHALGNIAATINNETVSAYNRNDLAAFNRTRDKFLGLILGIDDILSSQANLLLSSWLEPAKEMGRSVDPASNLSSTLLRVAKMIVRSPAHPIFRAPDTARCLHSKSIGELQQSACLLGPLSMDL